jgi:hypothetical protein
MSRSGSARESTRFRPDLHAWVLLALLMLGGQSASQQIKSAAPPSGQSGAPAPAQDAARDSSGALSRGQSLAAKIKFEDGLGKMVFSIKPEDDGAKLVDASDHEIARYQLKGEKLKIKDSTDHVLGYISGSRGKYDLKDPGQKTVLFELKRQEDGDWKLKDGHEKLLAKIKKRAYGFEIEDAQEKSLAKVKTKNGKVSLRDASDRTRYATRSSAASPLLLTCLGLDEVGDVSMRAAILVRIALDGSMSATPEMDDKP